MSNLTTLDPRDLYHAPHLMGETVHRIEKVIEAAAALQRWDDLQKAIDFLIECQQVIFGWWADHVREGRPKLSHDPAIVSVREAEERTHCSHDRVSRWRGAHKNLAAYRERVATAARRKAELEAEPNRVTPNSGENEWFTPARYIEAAREVMGGIDLDPATHIVAQRVVGAAQFYTQADDGLSLSWHGRVWLNPPYAQPLIGQFVDKLLAELSSCAVTEAILLTNNCTDAAWFHRAAYQARLLCFTLGRIRFVGLDGEPGDAPLQGQAFFYFGPNADRFGLTFNQFGFVR